MNILVGFMKSYMVQCILYFACCASYIHYDNIPFVLKQES